MFWIGNNKFPLRQALCCISNRAKKRVTDYKVLCVCGPESGKVAMTFFLFNIPLAMLAAFYWDFFQGDSPVWHFLMTTMAILIPVVDILFAIASSKDPGILPARVWTSS